MNNNEMEYKCITLRKKTVEEETYSNDELNIEIENNLSLEENNKDIYMHEETDEPNCLALTVRKDYGLFILKNGLVKTFHVSLKVAFCTLFLNILTLLL